MDEYKDLEERKRLYDAFKTGKRGNKSSKNVDWGKEESLNPDGLKCNFNINLCVVEGVIPNTAGGNGQPTA